MSFTSDPPQGVTAQVRFADVRLAILAAVTLTNPPITADEVSFANADRLLVGAQATASENGLYTIGPTGSELSPGGSFVDDQTPVAVNGLTAAKSYYWAKGANTASLTNGVQVLTASGFFVAAGTSVDLLGLSADDVLDSVKAALLTRATDADGDAELVHLKRVRVTAGTLHANREFTLDTGGSATAISVPVAIAWRPVGANDAPIPADAGFTSDPPAGVS